MVFSDPVQIDLSIRTLQVLPWLGAYVRVLRIGGPSRYLSFAQGLLLHHMPHVQDLVFSGDLSDYRPLYYIAITKFPVTTLELRPPLLNLRLRGPPPAALALPHPPLKSRMSYLASALRLIWALPDLRTLDFTIADYILTEAQHQQIAVISRQPRFQRLHTLKLAIVSPNEACTLFLFLHHLVAFVD